MNVEHCREFLELAQRLNFTEAAACLNITQPALSKHLAALERELGAELIVRDRKNMQLTEAGRVLFEGASIMVDAYDKTRESIESLKTGGVVRVAGGFEDADVASLMSMVITIVRNSRNVPVSVVRADEAESLRLLESGEVDLFVGYVDPASLVDCGFCVRPFVSNRLVVIVGSEHSFAGRSGVSMAELKGETLVHFVSDITNGAWVQIEDACRRHGFVPRTRPVFCSSDIEFFSTRLGTSALVWKSSQKEIGLLLETGQRACVPIEDEDACLVAYAVYRPEDEKRLELLFEVVAEAKKLLDKRRDRKEQCG